MLPSLLQFPAPYDPRIQQWKIPITNPERSIAFATELQVSLDKNSWEDPQGLLSASWDPLIQLPQQTACQPGIVRKQRNRGIRKMLSLS